MKYRWSIWMFAFGGLLNGEERTIDLNFVAQPGYPSTLTGRLSGSATLSIIEESSNALERTLLFVLDWEDSTYESELIEDTTTSIILEGTEVDP